MTIDTCTVLVKMSSEVGQEEEDSECREVCGGGSEV